MIVVDRLDPTWGEPSLALWMLKKVDPRAYANEPLTAYLKHSHIAEISELFTKPLSTYETSPRPVRNEEFLYVHAGAVYSVVVR